MNRKGFFQTFIPAGLATLFTKQVMAAPDSDLSDPSQPSFLPPYLRPGDTVGITCPAGPADFNSIQPCCRALKSWGLNIRVGKTIGRRWQRFGGSDKERLEDFQQMIDDETIDAIIFGKGGYGTMRIIDELNWEKFKKKPKWLVGYSDLTVVHLHAFTNLGIPTIHGDMSNGFRDDSPMDGSSFSLQQALFGTPLEYNLVSSNMNRIGSARGPVIGGNLSLVAACLGSKSDVKTDGCILFLEDVSEYKYTIDRMFTSLKRSGKLANLAGLVLGEFSATKDDKEEVYEMRLEDIIWDKVREYNYPVCFHFPSGHIRENRALKMGVIHDLNVGREIVTLAETGAPGRLTPILEKYKLSAEFTDSIFPGPKPIM